MKWLVLLLLLAGCERATDSTTHWETWMSFCGGPSDGTMWQALHWGTANSGHMIFKMPNGDTMFLPNKCLVVKKAE